MLSPYRFLLIVSTVDSPSGLATDSRTVQKFRLKVPWQDAKDKEPLKGSDAYWRLNDARF